MKNRYYLDFETNTEFVSIKQTAINLWCLKKAGEKEIVGVGADTFWKQIEDIKSSAEIYAHNGSRFDFWFILNYVLNLGWDIESKFQPFEKYPRVQLFVQGTKIYQMKLYFSKKKIIYFKCSLLLTSAPLSKLGQILGFPKLKGRKWYNYWAFIENANIRKQKTYLRKKEFPNDNFEYFGSYEHFLKLNKKFCSENNNCSCYHCYIIRDVKILEIYMEKMLNDEKIDFGLTIGSTSIKTLKNWLSKQPDKYLDKVRMFGSSNKNQSDFLQPTTPDEMRFFINSYAGGHTDFNGKYFNDIKKEQLVNGYSFDVNSLYPSVMVNNPIAVGGLYDKKPTFGNSIKILQVRIFELEIRPDYPPIFAKKLIKITNDDIEFFQGVNKQKIYAFKTKKGTVINIWEKEFEYYKKCYFIKYNIEVEFYVKTTKVFEPFITQLSEMKIYAKNPVERNIGKLLMNTIYGKFGQRIERNNTLIIDIKKDFDWKSFEKDENYIRVINQKTKQKIINAIKKYKISFEKYYEWARKRKDIIFLNKNKTIIKVGFWITMSENYSLKTNSAGTASHITSLARCLLFQALLDNRNKWLYCDTDSIYIDGKPNNIAIDNKKLGFWKPELKFSRIKVIEAKKYMLKITEKYEQNNDTMKYEWIKKPEEKIVCAGVKISSLKPTFETFEKGIEHSENQNLRRFVDGGILLLSIKKKY